MIRDEKGITLVELLVSMTLLSIIGIIVWNVFIVGTENSNEQVMKNQLIQEANHVQVVLRNIHRTSTEYQISFPSSCSVQVDYQDSKKPSEITTLSFEDQQICYEIKDVTNNVDDTLINLNFTSIKPKKEHHSISFKLVIGDKQDGNEKISAHTNLSRLKED